MGCARTATIATDHETYTNQRLRCDSALPPDYHAGCHSHFCHAALTSTRVDALKSVAGVAVGAKDRHHCHGPRGQRCASPCRPSAAPQHGAGQAVRMRIVSVLMIGSRMISVLTTRWGVGRRPPGQGPRKV